MKKIIISLSVIAAVAAVAIGASTAFFSDTETSTGNTFTAGAIDLGIDNTSYYNGQPNPGTSWQLSYDMDLCTVPNPAYNPDTNPHVPQTLPCMFFNFDDLKPGDWGEDTISLHVNNNDSWLCADVTLTKNDDVSSTEPELEVDVPNTDSIFDGELASHLRFTWWADDGDNVLENNEHAIHSNVPLGTGSVALADSVTNIWGDLNGGLPGNGPLPGGSDRYIGKAWCFGNATMTPYQQGESTGPDARPVICDGSGENNITQTDSVMADIGFRAVQSRNNPNFLCSTATQTNPNFLRLENETEVQGGPWTIIKDNRFGILTWAGDGNTFDYTFSAQGLDLNTDYDLIYYADGWPGNNPGAFIGTFNSGPSGIIASTTVNGTDLGIDLPISPDGNLAIGAKIWLVLKSDYNSGTLATGPMTAWNPSEYLFEGNVYINYNDTDAP